MKTGTKHTKGEWKIERNSDGYIYVSVLDDHEVIATINNKEEEKANAKLIVAAPQLLVELNQCIEAIESHRRQFRINGIVPAWQSENTLKSAKETIKKITEELVAV